TLTVRHWCEQYRLVEFLQRYVVQMLLVNSALLHENLSDPRGRSRFFLVEDVFDSRLVRNRCPTSNSGRWWMCTYSSPSQVVRAATPGRRACSRPRPGRACPEG